MFGKGGQPGRIFLNVSSMGPFLKAELALDLPKISNIFYTFWQPLWFYLFHSLYIDHDNSAFVAIG
jgi:hypothetical protein